MPELTRVLLKSFEHLFLGRRVELTVLVVALWLSIKHEDHLGFAGGCALHRPTLLEQLQRRSVFAQRLGQHHEHDARLFHAFARLRRTPGVHVVLAGQVDEAVAALEDGGGLEGCERLHSVPKELLLVVHLLDQVVDQQAIEGQVAARAEVQVLLRFHYFTQAVAHLDVLPLLLLEVEHVQLVNQRQVRTLVRPVLDVEIRVPPLDDVFLLV
mmetsp:Transcript_19693/g.49225  ORF Transcript_19693/g.49225 Transcript_19693/m.49225 type:complete len:212 (-) Transcript_19693:1124-1759(-)